MNPPTVETLVSPVRYSREQIEFALRVAMLLNRGRFVLCEPPTR